MRLDDFLNEKRRNPETNRFIPVSEVLRPYANDPNVFISMTDDVGETSHRMLLKRGEGPVGRNVSGPKIGVNPLSPHRATPTGVYAYPLTDVYNDFVNGDLPLGQDRPYVYILRASGKITDLNQYGLGDLKRDMDRLIPITCKALSIDPEEAQARLQEAHGDSQHPGGQLIEMTASLAEAIATHRHGGERWDTPSRFRRDKAIPPIWNALLRSIGHDILVDRGDGLIHGYEPAQAVFLTPGSYKVVDLAINREKPRLDEVTWLDRSPLADQLTNEKGRFVHFSNIPKLGVNPKKSHTDPHGIYFYPVDWVLGSNSERITNGQQYGIDRPYWFTAEVVPGAGIDLSKVTWSEVETIADRNGWGDELAKYRNMKPEERTSLSRVARDADIPGAVFWGVAYLLNAKGILRWSQSLKGIGYIRDPGLGIIHTNEPDQLAVFDIRALRAIRSGKTRVVAADHQDGISSFDAWKQAYLRFADALKSRFGGEMAWEEGIPSLRFINNNKHFTLTWSKYSSGLILRWVIGRVTDEKRWSVDQLRNTPLNAVIHDLMVQIEEASAREQDFLFPLAIEDQEALAIMRDEILATTDGFSIKVSGENNKNHKRSEMTIEATRSSKIKGIKLSTYAYIIVRGDQMSLSVGFGRKNHSLFATSSWNAPVDQLGDIIEIVAKSFKDRVNSFSQFHGPKAELSWRYNKIYSQDDWNAFIGWFALNSGLSLDGRIGRLFARDIEAYEGHPDRKALINDIIRIMS